MIAFYDQNYDLVATVTSVDGEYSVTGDEAYIERLSNKMSVDDFIDKFTNFNNGYTRVLSFKDGETAPEKLEVVQKKFW